jgi:hypothetical protein
MAPDPADGYTLLFGGFNGANLGDTWAFDGHHWSALAVVGPPARNNATAAYDRGHDSVLLFGGSGDGAGNFLNDTWAWKAGAWTQLHPNHSPSGRSAAAAAWDPDVNGVVLFGGMDAGGALGDMWIWNGTDWSRILTAHSPPPRYGAALGYVQVTDGSYLLLVAGDSRPQIVNWPDAWRFDGSDWSAHNTSGTPPSVRYGAAVAISTQAPSTVVLCCGASDATGSMGDEWLLNDAVYWGKTTQGPSARGTASERPAISPGMGGYDVFVFGGHGPITAAGDNSGGYLNDTWGWDGVGWVKLA